jgi:signal transduction histidine kinase
MGMRERVALAGGRLDLDSGPDGTRIHALIPEPPGAAAAADPAADRPATEL